MTSSTKHFESTHNPSEVVKIENPWQRTHTIYLIFFLTDKVFFIMFAEQTPVNKDSANIAIKYAFSAS